MSCYLSESIDVNRFLFSKFVFLLAFTVSFIRMGLFTDFSEIICLH